MTARLALVGGTNSDNLMRRMLAAAMTSALASRLNWAGKKNMPCSESKKPFKDTRLQHCVVMCLQAATNNHTSTAFAAFKKQQRSIAYLQGKFIQFCNAQT
ncbi:hypothetical protein CRENBAI_007158 [Crenichthys baileyi]|uniref:Uncharacterized protein n=1 Tax=Crenichthys baileyi TaxID=28760 RepID=A0AAV9RUQ4_9TELE